MIIDHVYTIGTFFFLYQELADFEQMSNGPQLKVEGKMEYFLLALNFIWNDRRQYFFVVNKHCNDGVR